MSFTQDDLKKLKKLARIECSEEEEEALMKKLLSTFKQIESLFAVDTENVPECDCVLEEIHSVMRDDEIDQVIPRETLLKNCAEQVGGMIRTPPVIQF